MIAFGASNNTDDKKISKLYINIFQKHTGLDEQDCILELANGYFENFQFPVFNVTVYYVTSNY